MTITLEPTTLESPVGDDEGMLARRDGRLFAVLSCLGGLHGDLMGHWYVEAALATDLVEVGQIFATLDAFEAHVERQDA